MADKTVFDAGDEAQVNSRNKALELFRARELELLAEFTSSYYGRSVLWRLMRFSGVNHSAPLGLNDMSRFEGRRDVGLEIEKEFFTYNQDKSTLMRSEADERKIEGAQHAT